LSPKVFLSQTIESDLLLSYSGEETAKQIWEDLQRRFLPRSERKCLDSYHNFTHLVWRADVHPKEFFDRFRSAMRSCVEQGRPVTEGEQRYYSLAAVQHPAFDMVIEVLEQDSTLSLTEIEHRLTLKYDSFIAKGKLHAPSASVTPLVCATSSHSAHDPKVTSSIKPPPQDAARKPERRKGKWKAKPKASCERCGLNGHPTSRCFVDLDRMAQFRTQEKKEETQHKGASAKAVTASRRSTEQFKPLDHDDEPDEIRETRLPHLFAMNSVSQPCDSPLNFKGQFDCAATDVVVTKDVPLSNEYLEEQTVVLAAEDCSSKSTSKGILVLSLSSPYGMQTVLRFPSVLKVPELRANLIAEDSLVELGYEIVRSRQGTKVIKEGNITIKDAENTLIYQGPRFGRGFPVEGTVIRENVSLCSAVTEIGDISTRNLCMGFASEVPCTMLKFHARLGHPNDKKISALEKLTYANLPNFYGKKIEFCDACALNKSKLKTSKRLHGIQELSVGERIGIDVCGKISPPSVQGACFFLLYIDYFSRKIFVELLADLTCVGEKIINRL
jgi:hypothetical protein